MEPEILANNLRRLRKSRSLTQRKVAEKAGIHELTYKKIENSQTQPRIATLEKVADALGVGLRELVTPVRQLHAVRFRSLKKMRSREDILAQVSTWLEDYEFLEELLDDHIPFIFDDINHKLREKDPINRAKEAAGKARQLLKLDKKEPIYDICGLLESSGVKVYQINSSSEGFFGLSVGKEDSGPAIIVNVWDRISVERWIFSAAHELGHLILHLDDFDISKTEENDAQEKEANTFASHFLMPDAGFRNEWEDTYGLHPVKRVFKIKRIFRVSYKTVLFRLIEMGKADSNVWKQFNIAYKQLTGKRLAFKDEPVGLRAREPYNLDDMDFISDRFHRLIRIALDEDKISLSRAAELMRISVSQMMNKILIWEGAE